MFRSTAPQSGSGAAPRTVVFFHAHPDDEALLTGGTMARLAAEGHRVVLVTATVGEAGLVSTQLATRETLGDLRRRELLAAADVLGCARVVLLGYADSGMAGTPSGAGDAFATAPVEEAAHRLAQILEAERADALTIYDPAGGYGHPDHVQVNRVGRRAGVLARTPVVLEGTVDRRALQRALRVIRWVGPRSAELEPSAYNELFTPHERITHCVDVSRYLEQKRNAMRAHLSQTTADDSTRTLARFVRLPRPLFRLVFAREWFVEHNRPANGSRVDDVLASLTN